MKSKSHIYYVKCTICEPTVSIRYFARHECNLRDTSESNNEIEIDDGGLLANDVFDSEGHTVGDLSNDGHVKVMMMIVTMKFGEIYLMNCFKKLTLLMMTTMMKF